MWLLLKHKNLDEVYAYLIHGSSKTKWTCLCWLWFFCGRMLISPKIRLARAKWIYCATAFVRSSTVQGILEDNKWLLVFVQAACVCGISVVNWMTPLGSSTVQPMIIRSSSLYVNQRYRRSMPLQRGRQTVSIVSEPPCVCTCVMRVVMRVYLCHVLGITHLQLTCLSNNILEIFYHMEKINSVTIQAFCCSKYINDHKKL